ncbi:PLP-dependent aminotransferase family protein [Aquabacterium sp.]|uniref:MocR-like pyridoxine biosynthesis transcription factor PdxR n=1 Tax=Aquabacterium sp. TaxID=1872578 RepID=UPI002CDF6C69|nr:PLP-dependent aminotransferase family protein [Aquabacterium sp.]HSW06886.1 PLP-dependent aminotransferase family protein [Aquabacterium sp.]
MQRVNLRQRVYLQLRSAIEQGTLGAGTRLPPSREHAQALGVARNTVLWALERLRVEGFVQARVGDGTYVAQGLAALAPPSARSGPRAALIGEAWLSQRGRLMADTALRWRPPLQAAAPFRIGAPEIASFPFALWDRLARSIAPQARHATAQYLDPAGLPALREAIAHWLLVSRGLSCTAEQVLVTSGSQQAIDLIGRLLLDVGDEVMVEDPGYPGIRACLLGHGAQVRPVAVDGEGLDIADGAARWPAARLVVVTPTHQFPLGLRMSLTRRLALIDWARQHGGWIVEDDYDGEFQFGTHRIAALASLPHAERVLYVGTFSKTLHPGLRLGFIVLPPGLAPAFAAAKALADRHSPGEQQAVLARFISEGHLLRHLRRMRELYPQRQALLIEALARASGGALRLAASEQGMHLMHEVSGRRSDVALSARAREAGVFLAPLSGYAIESGRRGWLFGYAGYDSAALRDAARRVGPLFARG